ncbi:MAG: efflux RND transporter permease subunit [bacterium]|jgi:predicted RND superfamily exporter protein
MWGKFSESILKYRLFYIALIFIITAIMGYNAKDVELSFAGSKILPLSDPEYVAYNKFKKKFGEDGTMMVLGLQTENIFQKDLYNSWSNLGDSIRKIDGIVNVLSVAHAFELKKDTTKRSFVLQTIHRSTVNTQEQCDSIRNVFLNLPFYEGLIYNKDSSSTLMAISFDSLTLNSKKRAGVLKEILVHVDRFEKEQNVTLAKSGLPYIRSVIANLVSGEFKLFLILALAITAIILLLFFRSFYAVLFPVIVVLFGVVAALGTIVLFGYKITILTGLIPPLIVVIGIPNSILILNKYHTEFMLLQDKFKALTIAIRRVGSTIFFANVTTAIGFGVFGFTNSEVLTEFGIIASLNVMITWLFSLILIPIIFSYLPNPKAWQTKHLENKYLSRFIDKVDYWVHNKRTAIYLVTLSVILISLVGMLKVNVNGYMVDDLPQNSPVLKDLRFFENNFDGVLPFEVQVDSKRKNGLINIPSIKKIEKLDRIVSAYPEFSRSISLNEVLKFSKQAFYNGDANFYALPSEAEAAFILSYAKQSGASGSLMKSYIDKNNQIIRISFQTRDVGSNRMNELLAELKPRIDSIFNPEKYDVLLTGSSVLFVKGANYLLTNLVESLAIAFFLVALLMYVLFKNLRMVIIALVPNIIPLIITASIMGYLGLSLKPSTILIYSIALGIASDQTLYFLTKFRHERKSDRLNTSRIISMTLKETGMSMIYTAIILFFGFGIFSASTFGGTVALGILLSITLMVAMLCNLILLPALLLSLDNKEKKD